MTESKTDYLKMFQTVILINELLIVMASCMYSKISLLFSLSGILLAV